MASRGHAPPLQRPPPLAPNAWAQVASSSSQNSSSPLHNPQIRAKLKETSSDFVKIDGDSIARARLRFQNSLYGK